MDIKLTDGGIYLNGKYTSYEAIEDAKNWINRNPEIVRRIFEKDNMNIFECQEIKVYEES